MSRRNPRLSRSEDEFPPTFLPRNIGRAADQEMLAVLEEDKALHELAAATKAAES